MSILGSNMLAGAAGRARHEIERSLRFNSGDSAHLTRTPSSASNSTTFTWSAWVKTVRSDSHETLFSATPSGDGTLQYDFILENDRLYVYGIETFFVYEKKLSRVLRDRSAWYHLVVAFDTTDSTAEDRIKIYVNGERQTDFATNQNPSASRTTGFNKTNEHSIGARTGYSGAQYFDGYQTEINFIDGSQLGPEYFGETDLETGAWIPRQYNGSYGTNGFYLKFADNSGVTATTLGKDSSGNSNNWTPNNFSVTAGAGNDSLLDTPTNNWCTLNPLGANFQSNHTLSNGNLVFTQNASTGQAATMNSQGTIGVSSGKWYWEVSGATNQSLGFAENLAEVGAYNVSGAYFGSGGFLAWDSSITDPVGSAPSYGSSDVIGFALDLDNKTCEMFKNNSSVGSFTTIPDGTYFPTAFVGSSGTSGGATYNFGQRAFAYTPPAGFQALNAKNLPAPTIKDGTKYFNTVLYTGNSSTQSVTGVGFQPDFTWIKGRGSATYNNHILTDVVRGLGKILQSNQFAAEATAATTLTSFDSDGFSLGAFEDVNTNNNTYAAWNWKAGGAASDNFDGSISSLVSANPEAGFSIVSFVAPSGSNQETVGHGLNVKPKVIISKNRDTNANNWAVFHEEATDTTSKFLRLNTTDSIVTYSTVWGSALPTSTVFGVTGGGIAVAGSNNIAYCFAEVEGYSKFGSYTGNGSDDGPYVSTNFRPAFVLVKSATNGNGWYLADTARSAFNVSQATLSPHSADAEDTTAGGAIDILSNGFKSRNSAGQFNDSGQTYVYLAFAEAPFKYANAR